jgi:hypothetical protein
VTTYVEVRRANEWVSELQSHLRPTLVPRHLIELTPLRRCDQLLLRQRLH